MASADQLRKRLLRDGRRLLAARGKDPGAVTVIVAAGPVEVVTAGAPAAAPASAPTPPADLPPVEAAILGVLSARPISSRAAARLAGRRFNTYFREALRSLVDAGLARRMSRGYTLS